MENNINLLNEKVKNLENEINLLKGDMNEMKQERGLKKDALESILKVQALCKINVPENPVEAEDLLKIALELESLGQVVNQCCEVLQKSLSSDNALKLFELAKSKRLQSLEEAARQCILHNFMAVLKHESFPNMDVEDLTWFLKSDKLNIDSEEAVFDAILCWLKKGDRKPHIHGLVTCIRLYCCDLRFLKSLRDHYLLWDSDNFQKGLAPVIEEVEAGLPEVAEKAEAVKRKPAGA